MTETVLPENAYTVPRVIKFRAWDLLRKEMIVGCGIPAGDPPPRYTGQEIYVGPRTPNYVLMQFTGVEDKNGREIFEGDVIEKEIEGPNGEKANFRGVVRYWGSGFFLSIPALGSELLYSNDQRNGRVIGNVYEQPSLVS